MGKILVTGGSGFIGKRLASFLRGNLWSVVSPDRQICDLLDAESVTEIVGKEKPNFVAHLAYPRRDDPNQKHLSKVMLLNLLGAIRKQGRAGPEIGLIHFGSGYEYSDFSRPCRETDETKGYGLYGEAKAALWKIIQNEKKIPWVHIRPFFVFGPGENEKRLFPEVLRALRKRTKPLVHDWQTSRDFLYIDDLCRGVEKILNQWSIASGQVFNLGSGKAQSPLEIVLLCAQALNIPSEKVSLIKQEILVDEAGHGFREKKEKNGALENLQIVADIGKAQDLLNFVPGDFLKNLKTYLETFDSK